jgi:apolipoprotein N-acyltransferase
VIDEKFHTETDHPIDSNEIRAARLYAERITALAKEGSQIVVLPEKMINLTPTNDSIVEKIFEGAATDNHITIVAGFTQFQDSTKKNVAIVVSNDGTISTRYQKVNLFEGEKYSGFSPGKDISLFKFNNDISGVAICKDMDYQNFVRGYGEKNLQVMFVPAWDFVVDGWLHSRMAILRSVENGFALVRAARQGELTISDYRGKVLSEANCTNNRAASLVGGVPVYSAQTIYDRFGDWFGFLIAIVSMYFITIILIEGKRRE